MVKYISAQPDIPYYIWQLEVQMNNFKKFGIEQDCIILLGRKPENQITQGALDFQKNTKATVLFFVDDRTAKEQIYIPSIRPNLIKKLYKEKYDLIKNCDVFYHDSDILFRKLPSFNKFLKKKISVSNTISYIGAEYIESKGRGLFNRMCSIVGLDPEYVRSNQLNSGGAQYFIPSKLKLNYMYWEKVERDCNNLYRFMKKSEFFYSPDHPIQAWTADMWSVLWNFWYLKYETIVIPELDFSWATTDIERWEEFNIYHNAGATSNTKHIFHKGDFVQKSPYNENFDYVSKKHCSLKYVEEILETGKALNLTK